MFIDTCKKCKEEIKLYLNISSISKSIYKIYIQQSMLEKSTRHVRDKLIHKTISGPWHVGTEEVSLNV